MNATTDQCWEIWTRRVFEARGTNTSCMSLYLIVLVMLVVPISGIGSPDKD